VRKESLKYIGISVMLAIFVFSEIGLLYAATKSMDEVRDQFKTDTGKIWEEASSEERQDFMYRLRGRKMKHEREERVKGETVPYFIREGFERHWDMSWDDATEEQQESYIERERDKRDQLIAEEQQRRESRIEKEALDRERLAEKKAFLEEKRRIREEKRQQKIEKKREKREREKERLEAAKERLQELRERSRSRR